MLQHNEFLQKLQQHYMIISERLIPGIPDMSVERSAQECTPDCSIRRHICQYYYTAILFKSAITYHDVVNYTLQFRMRFLVYLFDHLNLSLNQTGPNYIQLWLPSSIIL